LGAICLVGCNLLLTPILALSLIDLLGARAEARWLVLVASAPVGGSAAMAAGLLGLPMRSVALAQLVSTLALPVTAPMVAALVAEDLAIDPFGIMLRTTLIIGLPTLLGLLLRRRLAERRAAAAPTLRGLGVLGMAVIGCAVTHNLSEALQACSAPEVILAGVPPVSIGGALVVAAVAYRLRSPALAALGLGGALRNGSLLWVATLGLLPPEGSLSFQAATIWTFILPSIIAATLAALRFRRMAAA
jgi:hypothetical protein